MASNTPIIYVDTCLFLAWIKKEKRDPLQMQGVKNFFGQVMRNELRVVTSVATKAEVLSCSFESEDHKAKWNDFLRRRNISVVGTDTKIWALATEIRDYYQSRKEIDGLPTIELADSIHLATAIHYEAELFLTFDEKDKPGKKRGLIPLSPIIAGKYRLIIQEPTSAQGDLFT